MKTLNANRLFKMDLVSHHTFCIYLIKAVSDGHEIVTWSQQNKKFFLSIGSDGTEQSLFHVSENSNENIFEQHLADSLTQAVKSLALLEGSAPQTSCFLLVIGNHQLKVDVQASANGSSETIVCRIHGVEAARERAKAMLHDYLDERSNHGSMILSYDGERILGHGTLWLRHRIAALIKVLSLICWFPLWVAVTCLLIGLTPLAADLGLLGWICCTLIGLWLGLVSAPYVFARGKLS